MRSIAAVVAVAAACGAPAAPEQPSAPTDHPVRGVDHVGLAVTDLDATTRFFTEVLGFTRFRADPDYPANFLRNGHVIITLWRVTDPAKATAFDRKTNVGLHHLAFAVTSNAELDAMHERIKTFTGARVEFAPEPLGGGPARHMIFREPSGNRLELIHRPPQ